MFGGNRYWAEIMAPAVGPSGRVTVWEPTQFYDAEPQDSFAAFAAKAPNVSIVASRSRRRRFRKTPLISC